MIVAIVHSYNYTGSVYQEFVSSLPVSVHHYLTLRLDCDSAGVENDLYEIAEDMLNWEEKLVPCLKLTPANISDIKDKHISKPALQRWVGVSKQSQNCKTVYIANCMHKGNLWTQSRYAMSEMVSSLASMLYFNYAPNYMHANSTIWKR